MKKLIIKIIIYILLLLGSFYITLPPINIHSVEFWLFVFFFYFIAVFLFHDYKRAFYDTRTHTIVNLKYKPLLFIIPAGVFVIGLIVNFIISPVFMSKAFSERITIDTSKTFIEDVKEVDFNHVPLLDRDSTEKIGDRVVGEMTDLVSQFYVSNMYTQINYNNKIVRVTPLEYYSFIKWLTNRKTGINAYVQVDSVTGEASLVRLKQGMKYIPSAYFNDNTYRILRFRYPTFIFGDYNFEIDNDGNPFFIYPVKKYSGIEVKEDVQGVVIFNPINKESKYYDVKDVPNFVDHVYNPSLILEQVNDWGKYRNGFINSIFGQKNVVATTEGYNYMVQDDDVYLYTGITSVVSDESNLGFILTNLRTKETNYYAVSGAEEFSAMSSAEGEVQEMGYVSTFPLLINLNNRPTYMVSLKDNAGLVKMYGFVDVQDYQKVSVTEASYGIFKAKDNYLKVFGKTDTPTDITITVKSIKEVIIDSNTYYYLEDIDNNKYRVSIKVNEELLPFVKVGDKLSISFTDGTVREIYSIVY